MAKYYDVHNHLFNKHFLAKELMYRLMKEMKQFISGDDEKMRGSDDRGLKNVIQALRRYSHALRVFMRKSSTAVYEELDKTYKGEFILTPLTFDLTWCFAESADRDAGAEAAPSAMEVAENEIDAMLTEVEEQARMRGAGDDDAELWEEYRQEKELFRQNTEAFKKETDIEIRLETESGERGIFKKRSPKDGWEEQLRQIIELKNNPEYANLIYPFLAIDPRRPGIAEYARANVGKGKPFAGIKLYTPNGYSPADPLLFGTEGKKDGLYAFCEENGIPVTAHNSDGGFATLSKSVYVSGLIHVKGELHHLDNERLIFSKKILDKDAVYERAVTLNHPMIWRKVVEKYPKLLLNLAHFGGGKQLNAAVENPDDETLWSNGIIALLKDDRYNVYTDLSCFSDFNVLKNLISSKVYPEIKHRIMYGSDYTLLLFFENDFDNNVKQFKQIFGDDFDIIARDNPQKFLKHVI